MKIVKIENEFRFFKGSDEVVAFKPNDPLVFDASKHTYEMPNTNSYSMTIINKADGKIVNVLINKLTHKVMHLLSADMGLPVALTEVEFENDETSGFFHNASFESM